MSIAVAAGLATAAIGVAQGISGLLSSNATNRYQKKQLALQEQSSYQDLIDSYYTQQENITNLRNAASQVALARTQTQSDIGSSYSYLDRWQAYADTTLAGMAQGGEANYRQLAGAWADGQVAASETGRTGGSAALANKQNAGYVRQFTGDSMLFDTNGGLLGQNMQQQRLDLEADRQTALYNIGLGNQAIGMYDETAKLLEESITEQEGTNKQIASRLNDYYGDEKHWGGESMADAVKNAYGKYKSGKGDFAGKSEEELKAQLEESGAGSYDGRIIQGILDGIESDRKAKEAAEKDRGGDDDGASSSSDGDGWREGGRPWSGVTYDASDPDAYDGHEVESVKKEKDKEGRTHVTVTAR